MEKPTAEDCEITVWNNPSAGPQATALVAISMRLGEIAAALRAETARAQIEANANRLRNG